MTTISDELRALAHGCDQVQDRATLMHAATMLDHTDRVLSVIAANAQPPSAARMATQVRIRLDAPTPSPLCADCGAPAETVYADDMVCLACTDHRRALRG